MDFSQRLRNEIADLHLLKHPFYQDWTEGKLSKERLAVYAQQYYKHVEAFPRYISATHSLCQDAKSRKVLLENLNDEEGSRGKPHPELWLDFAEGVGAKRESAIHAEKDEATSALINTFFGLSRASYAQGLAALYAYEYQVPEVAETKIEGLKKHYGVTDARSLSFFEVHKSADVFHRQACEELLNNLSESEQKDALASARTAGTALWNFLTRMQEIDVATAA